MTGLAFGESTYDMQDFDSLVANSALRLSKRDKRTIAQEVLKAMGVTKANRAITLGDFKLKVARKGIRLGMSGGMNDAAREMDRGTVSKSATKNNTTTSTPMSQADLFAEAASLTAIRPTNDTITVAERGTKRKHATASKEAGGSGSGSEYDGDADIDMDEWAARRPPLRTTPLSYPYQTFLHLPINSLPISHRPLLPLSLRWFESTGFVPTDSSPLLRIFRDMALSLTTNLWILPPHEFIPLFTPSIEKPAEEL